MTSDDNTVEKSYDGVIENDNAESSTDNSSSEESSDE